MFIKVLKGWKRSFEVATEVSKSYKVLRSSLNSRNVRKIVQMSENTEGPEKIKVPENILEVLKNWNSSEPEVKKFKTVNKTSEKSFEVLRSI